MIRLFRHRAFRVAASFGIGAATLATGLVLATNWWIQRSGREQIFTSEQIPAREVAVVLGTSPVVRGRWVNPFFTGRMDAAAELFHAGKVRHLLVSGDNSRKDYDEPTAMRDALIERGVPAEAITLDYAGFRTLDTMARASAVFGLRECILVSDDFHLPRCIYLARAHGIDAVGYASDPIPQRWSRKTRLREIGSRTMAWLDVHLLRTKPKFYGPPVEIRLVSR